MNDAASAIQGAAPKSQPTAATLCAPMTTSHSMPASRKPPSTPSCSP